MAAVSTVLQAATDKASIPDQLAACHTACELHGWPVVAEITIPGHSRNYDVLAELIADCPEYGQIIHTISSGDVSLFVAYVYDRLWRTDSLRAQVTAICRKYSVQVYAVRQPIEPLTQEDYKRLGNEGARWLETVGGLVAESENNARIRRSRSGKEAVIRQGLTQYSNRIPYGYRKIVGSNLLDVIPTEAAWVSWIYERRAVDRWGYHRIAGELTMQSVGTPDNGAMWRDCTVRIILRNPIYKGVTHWGGARCEVGQHEAIITPELWEAAQVMPPTREHHRLLSSVHGHLLLSGLCVCGWCGYVMTYVRASSPTPGIACAHYMHSGGRYCHSNWHPAPTIEALVMAAVTDVLDNPSAFLAQQAAKESSTASEDELAAIDRELADLSARYERWSQLFEDGGITSDELLGHRQRIHGRVDDLAKRRGEFKSSDRAINARAKTVTELAAQLDTLPMMTREDLKQTYRRLISRVVLQRHVEPAFEWL